MRAWPAYGIFRHKSRLLAMAPVLVVLNLIFGAPLLCHLHCWTAAADVHVVEHMLVRHNHAGSDGLTTLSRGIAPVIVTDDVSSAFAMTSSLTPDFDSDLPQLDCLSELPGSNQVMVSAYYESADILSTSTAWPPVTFALMQAPQVVPGSHYSPPLDRPPALFLES